MHVLLALCCRCCWARRLEIIKQNNCRNRPINRSAHCLRPRPCTLYTWPCCVYFKQSWSRVQDGDRMKKKNKTRHSSAFDRFTPPLGFALVSLQQTREMYLLSLRSIWFEFQHSCLHAVCLNTILSMHTRDDKKKGMRLKTK